MVEKKGRIFSGMRPTGRLHLGNLLGALESWVKLQDDYECHYAIVDWHALTTGYEDTSELPENIREMALDWLSAGLDPEKSVIFVQSHVKEHAELHLLLSMVTPLSWLMRNPTYKEQLRQIQGREIHTYGFLGYPVLQAADILAYKADTVPVGEDQLPHLELSREIARRFNFLYGPVFPEPQAKLNRVTLLPGTDGRKMSKSYGNVISMSASPQEVERIVANMVTDPGRARRKDPGNPQICAVYAYQRIFAEKRSAEIDSACRTAGIGCVDCKRELAQAINAYLEPIRERRAALVNSPDRIKEILQDGAERARKVARATVAEARQAMRLG